MPDRMSEHVQSNLSNRMLDRIDRIRMPKCMSDRMPEQMPDKMSEYVK